jgi:hypothetical protein
MAYQRNIDYGQWAKGGFLLGVALLALGVVGEVVGHVVFGGIPSWENTLFVYSEAIGIMIGFFAPVIFAVVLPLTE